MSASSACSCSAGILANAASVGANTVNGPAPLSVSIRPASVSALASVPNCPAETAVSTMSDCTACAGYELSALWCLSAEANFMPASVEVCSTGDQLSALEYVPAEAALMPPASSVATEAETKSFEIAFMLRLLSRVDD